MKQILKAVFNFLHIALTVSNQCSWNNSDVDLQHTCMVFLYQAQYQTICGSLSYGRKFFCNDDSKYH